MEEHVQWCLKNSSTKLKNKEIDKKELDSLPNIQMSRILSRNQFPSFARKKKKKKCIQKEGHEVFEDFSTPEVMLAILAKVNGKSIIFP